MFKFCTNFKSISRLKSIHYNQRTSSSLSSATLSVNKSLKNGDQLHGYEVQTVEDIPELCMTAYLLNHLKSGSQHLHIYREDNNNMFGLSLKTTPKDSSGVAHILEHLALCGSQRYPIRDPFMKMLSRSLATFMNAFTTPDHTIYPFSTQNNKDFYNLLSIYLDAVFYPQLLPLNFAQEGWRLEHQTVDDRQSDIVFKGIVFNEMKGVFSSQSAIYARSLQNHLFPSNTYAFESGGDPLCIPNLTYEDLKQFHSRHYHPINARFFTYGNFPLESHLSFINEYILSRFSRNDEFKQWTQVSEQPKWSKPVKKSIECMPDPLAPFPDKQTTVSLTFMLENIANTHENFTLAILCSLLMDGPNAPLYQALIDSGLGSDFSPNSGFSNYTKQTFFSIGLQGIAKTEVNFVEKAIETALKNAVFDGFPMERIEAILHRLELGTKHQSDNYGLSLLMGIGPIWTHTSDPIVGLRVNEHVDRFRAELKQNPNLLKNKIKEYFLSNSHRLVLEMNPSVDYENNIKKEEQKLLEQKLSKLSKEDMNEIYKNGIELDKMQKTAEDMSLLPTLSVESDISRLFNKTNIERTEIMGAGIQWSAQPTNGITYFNAVLKPKSNEIPNHLVPYLPLFSQVMTKLGAGQRDRKELDQEINLRTGGLQVSVHVSDHPSQLDLYEKGLIISSHCLERNIEQMFKLWTDLFNDIHFDEDSQHLLQLIKICSSEMAMSLPHHGHSYAMSRSAASLGGAFKFREETSGLSSVSFFRTIASMENCEPIVQKLKSIASLLLNADSIRCSINGEAATIRPSLQIVERFIKSIKKCEKQNEFQTKEPTNNEIPSIESTLNEHNVFPFGANHLGKSVFCAPFAHSDYPKLKIASNLVTAKYLRREIREKGGAYGGGAKLNPGGVFSYYSYRDPHIDSTIGAFNGSAEWLSDRNNYSEQDIDEAKLSVFQEVDHPIMPSEQGLQFFVKGITDEMKHEYRMRLLDVNKTDIEEVAKRYLLDSTQHSGVVLIGPRSDRTASDPNWIITEERNKD